jgi:hypothetical protein
MKKNTVGYFIEGLKIIRDFRKFFFISLFFTLLLALNQLGGLFLGIVVGILGIFVSYYSVGYGVSIPLFLHDTEKGNPIDASHIYNVTKENAHRLFAIMVIYAFFILGGVGIVSMFLGVFQDGTVSLMFFRVLGLIMAATLAVCSFFPIAFSLEKKGIIASVRRSISLCKGFPVFFVFALVVQITHTYIASFLPHGSIWTYVMYFIGWFINSWIIATTYALWRDKLPPFKHV